MSLSLIPNPSGVKIYNVSYGKSVPQWISERKRRSLAKHDIEFERRIELIQDLEFPIASQRIKTSNDGQYLMAAGTYKPQIKVFELAQLSMKFERHLDNEIVQFQIVSDDYSKITFLRADRTLEFHAQFGHYHQLRIPKFGRDLMYHPPSCDLYVSAVGSEVYRINLEQGQFLNPLQTSLPGVNTSDLNPVHELLTFGGENGFIECWDPRSRKKVADKDISSNLASANVIVSGLEVTSLRSDTDGLTLAVGTSSGHVLLYDLRSSLPLLVKDHQYGFPIKSIFFHNEKKVISSDTKIMKIWERETSAGSPAGKAFASIEPPADINDLCIVPNSGLIVMACEQPKLMTYFVPALGTAPRWCGFLDNLTEELEEDKQEIYDDFKFITREELQRLGMTKLYGSDHLKPYMHGFFMDLKLYNEYRAISQPFEYEEYKKNKIKETLDKEAASRISAKMKLPKVNAKLATRLLQDTKDSKSNNAEILQDPRFKELFEREEFRIDENDEKYKLLHPVAKSVTQDEIDEHFEKVGSEGEQSSSEEDEEKQEEVEEKTEDLANNSAKQHKVQFYEIKSGHSLTKSQFAPNQKKLAFAQRVANLSNDHTTAKRRTGSMQVTFTPGQEKRENAIKNKNEEWRSRLSQRRGIKELRLQPIKLKKFKKS